MAKKMKSKKASAKKADKPAKKVVAKKVVKAAAPAKKAAKKAVKKAAKPVSKGDKSSPQDMPKPQHGEFMWNELMTRDDDRAVSFYGKLLGWKVSDWPLGPGQPPYRMMKSGERGMAGIMKMTAPMFPDQLPPHWMSYIAVDNVDKRFAQALEMGAEAIHPPSDIPQVGRFCIIKDPTGGVVSLMTPLGGTA